MAFVASFTAAVPSPRRPSFAGNAYQCRGQDDVRISHNCIQKVSPDQPLAQAAIKVEEPKLIGRMSRRDALLASAGLLSNLMATDAADARRIKPETRRKIKEKLDKLREKGGVTKERTDSNSSNEGQELPSSTSIPLVEATV